MPAGETAQAWPPPDCHSRWRSPVRRASSSHRHWFCLWRQVTFVKFCHTRQCLSLFWTGDSKNILQGQRRGLSRNRQGHHAPEMHAWEDSPSGEELAPSGGGRQGNLAPSAGARPGPRVPREKETPEADPSVFSLVTA